MTTISHYFLSTFTTASHAAVKLTFLWVSHPLNIARTVGVIVEFELPRSVVDRVCYGHFGGVDKHPEVLGHDDKLVYSCSHCIRWSAYLT